MRLRLAVVATLTLVLLLPEGGAAAAGRGQCAQPADARFGAEFTRLQAELGDIMGVPTACEQLESNGDQVQTTSTGVAIYRAQTRAAVFVRGEQHWSLTDHELVSWTGSWHAGVDPPTGVPTAGTPVDLSLTTPDAAVASILVVNLLSMGQDDPPALLLESDGTQYLVRTAEGCPHVSLEVGRPVYVRSPGPLGSPGAELVLLAEREACAIVTMQLAPGS